ncbi:DnaD domain protein [Brevibacillus fluminis]|uniref:DnaD domain protein n=1 Tax=Brevibacillus fluminis TaxID=511487 RepID=A0A3M8CX85_9BACL|nr:DnaD domain protein [Brevibacillus fluminis]RNB80089.1 DnaD domain protein [Brevibacillus fluminis]
MDRQILQLLQEGATTITNLLLKRYKRLSLSDEEMMLIIHLLSFQQEGNRFPTLSQLEERLSMPGIRLIQSLQKLTKEDWIAIDEIVDPENGKRYEQYNLQPLYYKLNRLLLEEQSFVVPVSESFPSPRLDTDGGEHPESLYSQFEQSFGRPLSSIEIETMQCWVEQDRYSEELIMTALREAQSVGKLYIRYIDRILLEWTRQKITTVEEARNYSLRFRRPSMQR